MHVSTDASKTPVLLADNGFSAALDSPKRLRLTSPGGQEAVVFQAPHKSHAIHSSGHGWALDVSPAGGLGVSAAGNGALAVWLTANGSIERELEGHVGDVYACRFFPSGKVVLSGGADLRLRIWDVSDGSCAATLTGHSGGEWFL